MSDKFVSLVESLTHTLHTVPGAITPELRSSIESWAYVVDKTPNAASELPEVIKNYVKKVSLTSFKVTDKDIEALKQAGYSEDAIFEITVSASMGASLKRLNSGLAALKGASDASSNP